MKVIPKKDLIILIEEILESEELLTKDELNYLFETYGDDWFVSDTETYYAQFSLCNKNKEREKIVGSK